MIQHVRRSFIAITMTMLTLVLLVPLCALNLITSALTYNQTQKLLEQIAQTEVYILDPPEHAFDENNPTEAQNVGIGKQFQHTTTITTTVCETTTVTTTTTTTANIAYESAVQPADGTTAPAPEQPKEQTHPETRRTEAFRASEKTQIVTQPTPAFTRPPEPEEPNWESRPAYTEPPPSGPVRPGRILRSKNRTMMITMITMITCIPMTTCHGITGGQFCPPCTISI